MSERNAAMWGVSAPWYDKRGSFPPFLSHTKRGAINEFKENFPESNWAKLKRQGWYVARVYLSWAAP